VRTEAPTDPSRRKASPFRLLALSALLAICAAACHRGEAPTAGEGPPSVILLTVDTLRADHLPFYGYDRDTAPRLSRLAADAVRFDRAFTTRGKTSPAYASMFTGFQPYRHGVVAIGHRLADANVTVAEVLAANGFQTLGFVSSTVMRGRLSHLHQGFDTWNDELPSRESSRSNYERRAAATTDAVLAGLAAADPAAPLFLFVHWIDPHGPYAPPADAERRFAGGAGEPVEMHKVARYQRRKGKPTLSDYVADYDNEIVYVDREIGRVLDRLEELGLYDRSLVLFTADHGEALGEHDVWFRHGFHLHDVTHRVPLLVKPPRARGGGRDWDGAVSLVDVLPTVLDYLGLALPGPVEGDSLREIVDHDEGPRERLVFSDLAERREFDRAVHGREGSLWAADCAPSTEAPDGLCSARFVDRASDPGQVRPLRDGPDFERYYAALVGHQAVRKTFDAAPTAERAFRACEGEDCRETPPEDAAGKGDSGDATPEELEALKALGYIED
jgi:arylsulfatase A-like enzyme